MFFRRLLPPFSIQNLDVQAGARGSSSPDGRKQQVRQSPRLSAKPDKSTCSGMRSGSLPKQKLGSGMRSGSLHKQKLKSLSFADALMSPTPEEKKARGQVAARK